MSLKRNAFWGIPAPTGSHPPSGGGGGGSSRHSITANSVLDCTSECRAKDHALLVLSSAYLGNLKLLKHCATVCGNPLHIRDALGRNALHIAASKGHLQLVQWFVARRKVKVDVFDWESKWSALHRSVYYGQLGAASLLIKLGADLNAVDNDGWSPLALVNADRERIKNSLSVDAVNVYTWGRNPNDTLGHDRTRNHPEKLDLMFASDDHIIQVVLCKFHSVFLSEEGHVLSCGHGPGGRLGHDSEQSIVTPRFIKAMEGLFCVGISAARDHTVILTKSGAVYTCGLNDAHQLGHGSTSASAPVNYLAPKLVRGLKSKRVIAAGAGRYHTAMCTETELYTVGKNLGQLGYEKNDETQVAPHAVPGIKLDFDVITCMSTSDSATAVLTKKHHVFVCTNFIVRHIRFGFLDKVSCLQFEVCASLSDRDYLRKVETEPTKLLVLDSEHKLWVWEPTRKGSIPRLFHGFAKHNVSHFSLGKSLTVVTNKGEVYRGNGSVSKPLNLQRVPNIQNASAIFTDFKANNLAYIQNVYRSPFSPARSQGTLTSDLSFLLDESSLPGSVCDMNIEAGGQYFSAHQFIINSLIPNFKSHLLTSAPSHLPGSTFKLKKKCDNPGVFDTFLCYLYGSHVRFLPPPNSNFVVPNSDANMAETTPDTSFASVDENDLTEEYDKYGVSNHLLNSSLDGEFIQPPVLIGQSTPRKKMQSLPPQCDSEKHFYDLQKEPVKVIQLSEHRVEIKSLLLLAASFELADFVKSLESIMSHLYKPQTILSPRLKLKRHDAFSDLTLLSKEGKPILCHRCVLVARSEYFRSMLLMGWRESSDDLASLTMPVGYKVLKAVIDFIYTDEFSTTNKGSETTEWVMSVLVLADQLLLSRLKELCEYTLSKILNLRNAVELLEFSDAYSAHQLKKSCLQFISVNASCFLEARSLDNVDKFLLEALSQAYQELVLPNTKRVIKFPDPSFELLPESYFHDDTLDNVMMGSGGSGSEDEAMHSGTAADGADVSSSSLRSTISPRPASNSRRKRKRKSSQSEKRHSTPSRFSPDPTSSLEDTVQLRANPSPPDPASPDSIISPCSPVSALAPDCTPRSLADTSSETNSCSNRNDISTSSVNSASPWINIEKKRKNFSMSDPRSKTSKVTDEDSVFRASSSPGIRSVQQLTPLSAPGKMLSRAKVKGETRTRLLNKFNDMTISDSELPGPSETAPTVLTKQTSPTPVVKGPWVCINNGDSPSGESLRDIMAREEETQHKNRHQQNKLPPLGRSVSNDSGHEGGTVRVLVKSQSIPVSKSNNLPSPEISSSPASVNPWGTPEPSSPAVSMRDLIAEAEAENKRKKRKPKKKVEERPVKRQPALPTHQKVSFASIIKSQESERNSNRAASKKALSLILLEERAISELEKAYSAAENPDEFIVITRCSKDHQQQDQGRLAVPSHSSPWGV